MVDVQDIPYSYGKAQLHSNPGRSVDHMRDVFDELIPVSHANGILSSGDDF